MGSIYRSGGGGGGGRGGSIYRSGGSGGSLPVGSAAAGGGGSGHHGTLGRIVHEAEHLAGQTGADLYHAAVNSPAGVYDTFVKPAVEHVEFAVHGGKRPPTFFHSTVEPIAQGVAHDLHHPLRHPGNTILDVLGFAEPLARIGEAINVAAKGAATGDIVRTAIKGAEPKPRKLTAGKTTVEKPESRAAVGRAAQHLYDSATGMVPAVHYRRVGKESVRRLKTESAAATVPAAQLAREGRHLSSPQQVAIRVVAEGVPIMERIRFHQREAATATKGVARKAHTRQVKLLQAAQRYVKDVSGKPQLTDQHLIRVANLTRDVAKGREETLQNAGLLTNPEPRLHAPGQLMIHGENDLVTDPSGRVFVRIPTAPGTTLYELQRNLDQSQTVLRGTERQLATLERRLARPPANGAPPRARPKLTARVKKQRDVVAEWRGHVANAQRDLETRGARLEPAATPGSIRIPYKQSSSPRAIYSQAKYRGGVPRKDPTLTHSFTGGTLRSGMFRNDTTKLVAESAVEAERHAALLRARNFFLEHAQDTPAGIAPDHVVALRTDAIPDASVPSRRPRVHTTPPGIRAIQTKYDEGIKLTKEETAALGSAYEATRADIFRRVTPAELQAFTPAELAAGELGYKFIDDRLLGGLDKPNPMLSPVGRRGLATVDAINNATKAAILYLKPAYALPNLLGNAALNLIQQGFLAPVNLARTVRLVQKLSPKAVAALDEHMGEGVSRALHSEGGVGQKAVNLLANKWSAVVDAPFRRSSFVYEAYRAGFRTTDEVDRLLLGNEPALHEVVTRSVQAIGDYGDLSPFERRWLSRVVFFYPWLKVSTKIAGHLALHHPVQSAVLGQMAAQAYKQNQADFGPVPSYLEGIFKVGGSQDQPLAVNPSSAALLGSPAQFGAGLAGLVHGNLGEVGQLGQQLTPAAALLVQALSRTNQYGGALQPNQSSLGTPLREMYQGLPQVALAQRIADALGGKGADRQTPPTVSGAAGQFLVGGLYPQKKNRAALNQAAAREHAPR